MHIADYDFRVGTHDDMQTKRGRPALCQPRLDRLKKFQGDMASVKPFCRYRFSREWMTETLDA